MFLIQQITSDPYQKQTLILSDGSSLSITMLFIPMQLGWFITELSYKDFSLKGLRISVMPNMLHQFRNQLPFGLACISSQKREPTQQDDFFTGTMKLYILSADEVAEYEDFLTDG